MNKLLWKQVNLLVQIIIVYQHLIPLSFREHGWTVLFSPLEVR